MEPLTMFQSCLTWFDWKRQLLLLFVLLNGGHHSDLWLVQSCPVRPLIKPCLCNEISKGLEIVCEGVQLDSLKDVFENLQTTGQTIMYLKMKNNHMRTFPSNLLNNISVRHLMAHKCNMVYIDQSAFFGIRDEIESLDLSQNKFNQIPSALKGLASLASLNLNYNQIESIDQNAFDGLTSLLRLSLFGNRISYIHPQAFIGIGVNLTQINLGGNQLSSVPSDSLKSLISIQRLQMHENQILTLERKDLSPLSSMTHLDVLNLANNRLKHLPSSVFIDLKALNSIDLESNQLSTIDDRAFEGREETLHWLKLDSNQLPAIPSQSLRRLTQLRELNLKNNLIKRIERRSFESFGDNIKFLYLQKNRIEIIENDAFDNLVSLEWLYLNSNRLRHLPRKLFDKATNLSILDFHDNPLVCRCDMLWYRDWIEQNEKNLQMAQGWKETKCYYDPDNPDVASASTPDQNVDQLLNDLTNSTTTIITTTGNQQQQQQQQIYLIEMENYVKCRATTTLTNKNQRWLITISSIIIMVMSFY